MKKALIFVLSIIFAIMPVISQATYLYIEEEGSTITGGIKYEEKRILTENGWIRAYIAYIDLANPNTQIGVLTAEKGTSYLENVKTMAQKNDAAVAINADFFNMNQKQTNMLGMAYTDGEMLSTPALDRQASFVLTDNNEVIMDYFSFSSQVTSPQGYTTPIYQINKMPVTSGGITMLTHAWAENSYGKGLKELVVQNDVVIDILDVASDACPIPQNGYVLTVNPEINGFFDNFVIGDTVTVETTLTPNITNIKEATGGNTILVENGAVYNFTSNVTGYAQRSSVGVTKDGKTVILCATDGRETDCPGLSQTQMANLMIHLGADKAINLDGGGSTTLVAKNEAGEAETKNSVSSLRAVSTSIAAFDKGIRGKEAVSGELKLNRTAILLGESVSLASVFYDEYGNIIKNASNIRYYTQSGEAIENSSFTPGATGTYKLYAAMDKALCEASLYVTNKIASVNIKQNDTLQLSAGEKVQLSAEVYDINGVRIDADPKSLIWESTNSNVAVNSGSVYAKTEESAVISAVYDGKADYLTINPKANGKRTPFAIASRDISNGSLSGGTKVAVSGSVPKGASLLNRLFALRRLEDLSVFSKSYITSNHYESMQDSSTTTANGFSTYTKENTCFVTIATSNNKVYNAAQWSGLVSASMSEAKNLVVITQAAPAALSEEENTRIKNILGKASQNGKNVFYVYSGSKGEVNIENNVRYISVGELAGYTTKIMEDNKDYCSYLVFHLKGDEIRYEFVR